MIKSVIKQFIPSGYEDLIDVGFDVFVNKKAPASEQVEALANKYITDEKIQNVQRAILEKYISECEALGAGKYLTILLRPQPGALLLDFIKNDIAGNEPPAIVNTINLMTVDKAQVIPFVISLFNAMTAQDAKIAELEEKLEESEDRIAFLSAMEQGLKEKLAQPAGEVQPRSIAAPLGEGERAGLPAPTAENDQPDHGQDDDDTEIEKLEDLKPGKDAE